MSRTPRKPIRVPKLSRRKDDGRLYTTDPDTRKQIPFDDELQYENWRVAFIERRRNQIPSATTLPIIPMPAPGAKLTVERLGQAFMEHARTWYVKDGKPTSQVDGFRAVTQALNAVLGDRRVNTLRSADLELVLEHMIEQGLIRRTINAYLAKMKTLFRWGVKKDYVDGETFGRILAVEPLKMGRTRAKEKPRVGAVNASDVELVLAKLKPTFRAMVELQWYSGMRPGEVCRIRPEEINQASDLWEYQPARYKTQHRHEETPELRRRIFFGPRAQAVLSKWLKNARPGEALFRTRGGKEVSPNDYWGNVVRACKRAGVPKFHPSQLRHATATLVRQLYGAEAARVYLGHENLKTTEIYAEKDIDLARKVAGELG